jgi:hypothetical protein
LETKILNSLLDKPYILLEQFGQSRVNQSKGGVRYA